MKLLVLLFGILVFSVAAYFLVTKTSHQKSKIALRNKAIVVGIIVFAALLTFLIVEIKRGQMAPDAQCSKPHVTTDIPPSKLKTAADYFDQGNYDYDTGNCVRAIADYSRSIELDPKNAQVWNNRGYTYMRLRDYKDALSDLNIAIALRPDYPQALMNRGDIHNYYFEIDRAAAITDYEKVISLIGTKETNVCGHLFLAKHNGWNLGTFLALPFEAFRCGN